MNYLFNKYKEFKGLIFIFLLKLKKTHRKITGKSLYYVIGDSHVLNFLHEAFIVHHIGPATAYRLNFKESTTKSREKIINLLNEIYKKKPLNVIFVFGELDARIHINKVAKENKISTNKVIEKVVKAYMNFLKFVKKKYPLTSIYVFNVLPQGEEENIYNYHFYANRKERVKIAEKMNQFLREYSKRNNFKFIYIYDKLINKKGERKKEYAFDDVHYNRKIIPYMLDYINKIN